MILSNQEIDKLVNDFKKIHKLAKAASGWGDIKYADDCEEIAKLAAYYIKKLRK